MKWNESLLTLTWFAKLVDICEGTPTLPLSWEPRSRSIISFFFQPCNFTVSDLLPWIKVDRDWCTQCHQWWAESRPLARAGRENDSPRQYRSTPIDGRRYLVITYSEFSRHIYQKFSKSFIDFIFFIGGMFRFTNIALNKCFGTCIPFIMCYGPVFLQN